MNKLIVVLAAFALTACGVETATTAASVATLKKQEVEQGQQTKAQAMQKVDQAVDQIRQNAQRADDVK